MSRSFFVLHTDEIRARVLSIIKGVPQDTRIEIKDAKRTLPQNARMWAMLTDVSRQVEHCGRFYTADQWKVLMLHAFGAEIQFLPALDNKGFIPMGLSSSDLSVEEMTELIEFMFSWGAERGVKWSEPEKGRPFAPRETE